METRPVLLFFGNGLDRLIPDLIADAVNADYDLVVGHVVALRLQIACLRVFTIIEMSLLFVPCQGLTTCVTLTAEHSLANSRLTKTLFYIGMPIFPVRLTTEEFIPHVFRKIKVVPNRAVALEFYL